MSDIVRFIKQDGFIHAAPRTTDFNLCGLAMESRDDVAENDGVEVEPQTITCPNCLFIIACVKAIPARFAKPGR